MSTYVVFPHLEGNWNADDCEIQRDLARIMAASVRQTMPGVPVKMLTDEKTPAIEGIEPIRISTSGYADFIPWVCDACSRMDGEVLYLDSDVVVRKDLRPLLNVPADLVLPWRGMKIVDNHVQPFIFGCVAYKRAAIWEEVKERVLQMPQKERAWYGSQIAVFDMWMEEQNGRGKWKIVAIPRDTYNYTPQDADEAPADKWVLHYKGRRRKSWMLAKWRHLIEERAAA